VIVASGLGIEFSSALLALCVAAAGLTVKQQAAAMGFSPPTMDVVSREWAANIDAKRRLAAAASCATVTVVLLLIALGTGAAAHLRQTCPTPALLPRAHRPLHL
jgi:ABC-type uncharacterized transport system YnjBCD permease subunit